MGFQDLGFGMFGEGLGFRVSGFGFEDYPLLTLPVIVVAGLRAGRLRLLVLTLAGLVSLILLLRPGSGCRV